MAAGMVPLQNIWRTSMTDICELKANHGNFAMDIISSSGEALSDDELNTVSGGSPWTGPLVSLTIAAINWVTNGSGSGKAWDEHIKNVLK
jgi:bacteriocin-like protein